MVRVWPDENNRELTLEITSEDGNVNLTTTTLNGADEPIQHIWWYKSMPAGEYEVRACLLAATPGIGRGTGSFCDDVQRVILRP